MQDNNAQFANQGNYVYSTMLQNINPQISTGYAVNGGIGGTGNLQGFHTGAMTVGGGVGDDAVDVTYSTKPDVQVQQQVVTNLNSGAYASSSFDYNLSNGQNVGLGTTVAGTTVPAMVQSTMASTAGSVMTGENVMGFGQGGDDAIDVTYSTKPDNQQTIGVVNTGITT